MQIQMQIQTQIQMQTNTNIYQGNDKASKPGHHHWSESEEINSLIHLLFDIISNICLYLYLLSWKIIKTIMSLDFDL